MNKDPEFVVVRPLDARPSPAELDKLIPAVRDQWHQELHAAGGIAIGQPKVEYRDNPNWRDPATLGPVATPEPFGGIIAAGPARKAGRLLV